MYEEITSQARQAVTELLEVCYYCCILYALATESSYGHESHQ